MQKKNERSVSKPNSKVALRNSNMVQHSNNYPSAFGSRLLLAGAEEVGAQGEEGTCGCGPQAGEGAGANN